MSDEVEYDPRVIGDVNPAILCPYCQERGHVETETYWMKSGVSGGKLTAMFLTFGISLLFVGLSGRRLVTELYCENCTMRWFA